MSRTKQGNGVLVFCFCFCELFYLKVKKIRSSGAVCKQFPMALCCGLISCTFYKRMTVYIDFILNLCFLSSITSIKRKLTRNSTCAAIVEQIAICTWEITSCGEICHTDYVPLCVTAFYPQVNDRELRQHSELNVAGCYFSV